MLHAFGLLLLMHVTSVVLLHQDRERTFLKEAFGRVQSLEAQRVRLTKDTMLSVVKTYIGVLAPLHGQIAAILPPLEGIDPETELAELQQVAATSAETAEKLSARQADTLEGVCQVLHWWSPTHD